MKRVHHVRLLTLVATVFILCAVVGATGVEPIRVLVLLGGEHHPYEAGSKIMIDVARKRLDIKADFVRIDNPPEGFPKAEKATIPSNIAVLEDPGLSKKYDVIVAYNQSNWVKITERQMKGYLNFVRNGGGLVAIHSATETFQSNPEYVQMLGASFVKHEPYRKMHIMRILGDHPILEGVKNFDIMDEFYYHDQCHLEDKHVLLVCQSPDDQRVHPIAWTKTYGKGRVFFTALGHSVESCSHPSALRTVTQGIAWAAGRKVGEDARSADREQ